jgi:hypothetical protein
VYERDAQQKFTRIDFECLSQEICQELYSARPILNRAQYVLVEHFWCGIEFKSWLWNECRLNQVSTWLPERDDAKSIPERERIHSAPWPDMQLSRNNMARGAGAHVQEHSARFKSGCV